MPSYSLAQLAQSLQLAYEGCGDCVIEALATLRGATPQTLCFFENKQYRQALTQTHAAAVIIHPEQRALYPGKNVLLSEKPYLSYAQAAALFQTKHNRYRGVHASVVIGERCHIADDVVLAANVVIGDEVVLEAGVVIAPNTVIGNQVIISRGTEIKANVTICDKVSIGCDCIIHPGAVIGGDGFGNAHDGKQWHKVPQLGGVVIGDKVEVGANTTIDCGAIDDTVIANGARIDNLVQLAHNVKIGENTAIAAGTGIAGSTSVGKNCMLGGSVGVNGHIKIGDGVMITGMTMVTHSLPQPGIYSSGIPVAPSREWRRNVVRFKQLDDIVKRVKQLENES